MKTLQGFAGKWLPWMIAVLLGVLLVVAIRIVLHDQDTIGGYSTSRITFAMMLFQRDSLLEPQMLHVIGGGTNNDIPVPGVRLHTIPANQIYEDNAWYRGAMTGVMMIYNQIAVGQACSLALSGENSPRIQYVLKMGQSLYAGLSLSNLYGHLSELHNGNAEAKAMFERVVADQMLYTGLQSEYFKMAMTNLTSSGTPSSIEQ